GVALLAVVVLVGSAGGDALGALPTNPLQIVVDEVNGTLGTPAPLRFPADDSSHPGNAIEYWQWWLHLTTSDGRRFGAVVVFYEFPLSSALDTAGVGVRRTDVRLTDLSTGAVYASSKWYDGTPAPSGANGFDLSSLGQTAVGA